MYGTHIVESTRRGGSLNTDLLSKTEKKINGLFFLLGKAKVNKKCKLLPRIKSVCATDEVFFHPLPCTLQE